MIGQGALPTTIEAIVYPLHDRRVRYTETGMGETRQVDVETLTLELRPYTIVVEGTLMAWSVMIGGADIGIAGFGRVPLTKCELLP